MPRRRYADENVEFSHTYNERNFLHEPATLHIMEEMEVLPLSPPLYMEDEYSGPDKSIIVKPLQMVNGNKRRMVVIPEKSSYFQSYRDDFVLFQKFPQQQLVSEDYFCRLPDEVVLRIFQLLPKPMLVKCAEVCKRWKYLSYDDSLWARYDFGKRLIGSGVFDILLRRGISVLRLAMCEIKSPVFVDSEFASRQRYSRLQYLDLSMATISPEGVTEILSVCNKLKKLSLEACTVNEDCCRFISQNTSLEVLNMSMCSGLNGHGLRQIAARCIKLKEWNLAWTLLDVLSVKTFLPFLPSTLTRLNLSGNRETFDDSDLLTTARTCPNLVELDISDCHLLTEVSFITLLKTCSNLEHLHTSRAYKIPTHCYRLLKHQKKFRNLEIFRTLTDDALAQLRDYIPDIKINTKPFSTIARPTVGIKRTSIWDLKVRD